MTALLLWLYLGSPCSATGADCGVVQSKHITVDERVMAAVETGRAVDVVRVARHKHYWVVRRWCWTVCEYVPTETDERGYDRAVNDREWEP